MDVLASHSPSVPLLSFARFSDGDVSLLPVFKPDLLLAPVEADSGTDLGPAHPPEPAPGQPPHAAPNLSMRQDRPPSAGVRSRWTPLQVAH